MIYQIRTHLLSDYTTNLYIFWHLFFIFFSSLNVQVFCWVQSSEETLWGQSPSPPLHLQCCPPPPCRPPHTQRPAAGTAALRPRRVRRPASPARPPCRAYPDPAGSAARAPSTYQTASQVTLHSKHWFVHKNAKFEHCQGLSRYYRYQVALDKSVCQMRKCLSLQMCQCSTAVRWRGEHRYRTSLHPSLSKTFLNRMWTMRWLRFSSDVILKTTEGFCAFLSVTRLETKNETGNASSWYFSADFVQTCEQQYIYITFFVQYCLVIISSPDPWTKCMFYCTTLCCFLVIFGGGGMLFCCVYVLIFQTWHLSI